jgi:sugar/nucleoside kinase (ribokinase family)
MADITRALQEALEAPAGGIQPEVLVAADLNFDYIYECPALEGGREVLIRGFSRELAGAGGIVACGLARLGAHVHLLAEVGDDADGRELYEEIARRGVRREGIRRRAGARSAFTLIFADEASGRPRQVATFQGTSLEFSPQPPEYVSLLERCALAYSCNYFLLPRLSEAIPALFRAARERGRLTAYDANAGDGWGDPKRLELLREGIHPVTDLIFLNQDEAAQLTRQPDPLRAIEEVRPAEATVVLKLGAQGAVVRREGRRIRVGAFPLPGPVRDTVGAGDCFQAAFLYFLLRGLPVAHCAALASANAASSVLAPGGTAGQQDRRGLSRLLGEVRVLEGAEGGIRFERAQARPG